MYLDAYWYFGDVQSTGQVLYCIVSTGNGIGIRSHQFEWYTVLVVMYKYTPLFCPLLGTRNIDSFLILYQSRVIATTPLYHHVRHARLTSCHTHYSNPSVAFR